VGGAVTDASETNKAARLDADEVGILLIGNREEQDRGIDLIDRHLRGVIFGVMRGVALSLRADELRDGYQDVMLAITQAAREKRYDANQPLLPFLFTLARRKAIDLVRKKTRKVGVEQVLDAITGALADTKVGEAWRIVAAKHDGQRMLDRFRNAVVRMPERQRLVASVMIDGFPDELSLQEIQEELHRRTGEQLTVVAVRSARREVRRKIAEQLVRAGYMERENHDDTE